MKYDCKMYSFLSWFYFFWLDLLHRPEQQQLIVLKCGRGFNGFGCGEIPNKRATSSCSDQTYKVLI